MHAVAGCFNVRLRVGMMLWLSFLRWIETESLETDLFERLGKIDCTCTSGCCSSVAGMSLLLPVSVADVD